MNKVKVIHLITLLEFGGAQGNTIYTVSNLDPSKFETHLWGGRGAYWDDEVKKQLGESGRLRFFPRLVRSIHPIYDLLCILELTIALRRAKPTILHTHSSKAGILGRIAGWLAGVPIQIHTFHGFGFNAEQKCWTRALFITLEKITAKLTKKLIFVSEDNRKTAREKKIGTENQYELIRSGIPIRKIQEKAKLANRQEIKKNLNIPDNTFVITTIGAFKPQKNLQDFLTVASNIRKTEKDVQFLVIGDGKQRHMLEKTIFENDMSNVVKLLGWREDIPALLSITDIFVMTSLWEGLPRALVEALVLDIPALCYDTDGVRDILEKGGGEIIPQKDTNKMTERLQLMLKNSDNLKKDRLSPELQNQLTQEFDIDHMVHQQETLYLSLISRP